MQDYLNCSDNPRAMFFSKLEDHTLKCELCGNECMISEDAISRCKSRMNVGGEMQLCNYAMASSIAVDPIEKKPLYHFYPGTKVFSLGGWGCNFCCTHCQNWEISQPQKEGARGVHKVTPKEAISMARQYDCEGICWTYNEPAVWFEYTYDSARMAKEQGLYTAYVTNGFMNEKPLRMLAPFLDAYRVDFKAFDNEFYREICAVKNWLNIYTNTVLAKEMGIHVEVVTNIIPGWNDDIVMLNSIAKFIAENLGHDTPWHVTRFFPQNKMTDIEPTPLATLDQAVEIGKQNGLLYIYRGNCPGKSDTICPNCNNVVVERNFGVKTNLLSGGNCKFCGQNMNIKY